MSLNGYSTLKKSISVIGCKALRERTSKGHVLSGEIEHKITIIIIIINDWLVNTSSISTVMGR